MRSTTGGILFLAAYPLVLLAEVVTQKLSRGTLEKQGIIELFNASSTLEQRILIILLAVTDRAPGRGIFLPVFLVRRAETILRSRSRSCGKRVAVRCGPRSSSLVCAALRSRNLFHDRVRMERFASRFHDDACALQCARLDCTCLSRGDSAMKLREVGEDRLLAQLLPKLAARSFGGAGRGR